MRQTTQIIIVAAVAGVITASLCQTQAAPSAPLSFFAVTITIDAAKPIGDLHPIWRWCGYDEPNYTYAPNGKKLIAQFAGETNSLMSEPIPTEISIGGKIREDQVPGLCQMIAEEGVSLEWGDARFTPETAEELLAACQEHDGVRVLWLCDDQANYGRLPELAAFLERELISFRQKSDAKYDYDAEIIEYRPELGEVAYSSDNSGQPLVPLKTLTSIAVAVDQATNTADGQTALELLRRLRNIQQLVHEGMPKLAPPLEPFEIVGQGARKET